MKRSISFIFLGLSLLIAVLVSVANFHEKVVGGVFTIGDYVFYSMVAFFAIFVFAAIFGYEFFKKAHLSESQLFLRRLYKCIIWIFITGTFVMMYYFVSLVIDNVILNWNPWMRITIEKRCRILYYLLILCGGGTGILFRVFVNELRSVKKDSKDNQVEGLEG